MNRADAIAFHTKALDLLKKVPSAQLRPVYGSALDAHFHTFDTQRNKVPLWPYELDLIPSEGIRELVGPVGYRYFMAGMAEHFWMIRLTCGLMPDHQVLDVGCGFGKTGLALKRYLRPPGGYTGFDIQPRLTTFAAQMFKNLKLDHYKAESFPIVGNPYYTGTGAKAGGTPPEKFAFPYPDAAFDVAVSFSVFTHLRSKALSNYATNLGRVIKPGGKALLSFYLLDNAPDGTGSGKPWSESPRRLALRDSPDPDDRGALKVLRQDKPEYMVAYKLSHVQWVLRGAGFEPVGEPLYGSWSGRADYHGHQDYLVFRKAG